MLVVKFFVVSRIIDDLLHMFEFPHHIICHHLCILKNVSEPLPASWLVSPTLKDSINNAYDPAKSTTLLTSKHLARAFQTCPQRVEMCWVIQYIFLFFQFLFGRISIRISSWVLSLKRESRIQICQPHNFVLWRWNTVLG